jgi:hypothetical protein
MPRVLCKLCAFEAVQGTVLCNGHLEGFKYAVSMLTDKQVLPLIHKVMQQPAEPCKRNAAFSNNVNGGNASDGLWHDCTEKKGEDNG